MYNKQFTRISALMLILFTSMAYETKAFHLQLPVQLPALRVALQNALQRVRALPGWSRAVPQRLANWWHGPSYARGVGLDTGNGLVDAIEQRIQQRGGGAQIAQDALVMVRDQFGNNNHGQPRVGSQLITSLSRELQDRGAEILNDLVAAAPDLFRPGGAGREVLINFAGSLRALMANNAEGQLFVNRMRELSVNQARTAIRQLGPETRQQLVIQGQEVMRNLGPEARAVAVREIHTAATQLEPVMDRYATKVSNKVLQTAFLATVASIGIWYGAKFIWNTMHKPQLIIESSQMSLWEKLKGLVISSRKDDAPEMIFSPSLEKRLSDIVAATKKVRENIKKGLKNVKYSNLLLWGPSGTGKTLYAKKLAKESGMDYVTLSGAGFSKFQDGTGILAMDELFAWANKSTKGLLIFIDEAETLLGERKKTEIHSESYKLFTNFLNHTGERSDKFMLVFATNYPNALDMAMTGRIDDSVEMALPASSERAKILQLYRKKILYNKQNNSSEFITSVEKYLNDAKIEQIAARTEGLSCRELSGIINKLNSAACVTDTGLVSDTLIDEVVDLAIKKNKEFAHQFHNNALAMVQKNKQLIFKGNFLPVQTE